MMKTARSTPYLTALCIGLLGAICGLVLLPKGGAPTTLAVLAAAETPTVDATGTSAMHTIEARLATTNTPTATPTPTGTPTPSVTPTLLLPTPDLAATKTVERMQTEIADTRDYLTLQPTPTPNLAATKTKEFADIATAVQKTVVYKLTKTPLPISTPTPSPPPVIPTATRSPATVNLAMIIIPAGDFVMGSSAADSEMTLQECNQTEGNCQLTWFDGEQPTHTLYLPEFRISKYEVTNGQYKVCVANGICPPVGRIAAATDIPYDANFFADALPVVAVSWDNANTFCRWLGARLPTEEEWEKAARSGDGARRYPWGYAFEPGRANLASGFPTAVGSYPNGASPYGVQDLAGNVFEWTATATGDGRYLLRGGAWSKFYFRGRVADRGTKLAPNFVNYDIGFRCAR